MTSLAARLFSWAWAAHPLTQLGVILAIGWAWVLVSSWLRAGDSLRASGERRGTP